MKHVLFFVFVFTLFISFTRIQAQIPKMINYQGMLMGTNDQPVPEGDYKLTFSLYNDAGTPLWTEVHDPVSISGGEFHVQLGLVQPLNLPFNEHYLLGIKIGNDPELQPRISLTSAAYSLNSDKVGGIPASMTPEPNTLFPLGSDGKFPLSVLPGGGPTGNYLKKNVPDTSEAANTSPLLLISNTGTGDGINARGVNGNGLTGRSESGDGVEGWTNGAIKSGIFGHSTDGYGISGHSNNNDGIRGWTGASNKSGVYGHTSADNGYGLTGYGEAAGATGVFGKNTVSGNYAKLGTDTYGLQVGGLGRFDLATGQINISTPGGWPGIIAFSSNGHRRDIIVWDDGISFEVSGTNAAPAAGNGITINQDGNVGIGNTNPASKLDINFGSTGSLSAGTPLGNGPGWIILSQNGHRRDIVGDNNGVYIGASSGTGSANAAFQVSEAGYVGIGLYSSVPSNILTVVQNSATDPIADAWTTYSSRRWKMNIQPIEGALNKVEQLSGVTFDWKGTGKHDIGLIAEDVARVIPEVVAFEENGTDAKSVDYARLVSVLIQAMKEQQNEIEELKATIRLMGSK
jgi:hypothetical protein